MSAPMDHLGYNRQSVAAAYRRLADTAVVAAEVFADPDATPDETDAARGVLGRVESVRHALLILEATRTGIAKAARERVA